MTRAAHHLRLASCIALLALIPMAAYSQSSEPRPDIPIDTLKELYLACERSAAEGDLDTGEIMRCSVAYEELKRRAFDGNFKLLKVWADTRIVAVGS